jgi:voltage-gated potassium channel Kch
MLCRVATGEIRGEEPSRFRWVDAYLRRRHTILFYSLLVTLAVSPVLGALGQEGRWLQVFLGTNLIAASTGQQRDHRSAFLLVALFAVGLRALAGLLTAQGLITASDLGWAGLALVAAAGSVRFALTGSRISAEHVYAGLSAYLLLGHFFGLLYWNVDHIWPGSFTGSGTAPGHLGLDDSIYFSFVTLATLGYGDILPASDAARGLAVFEAVAGQLYIGVLVARLVGLYIAHSQADNGRE